MQKNFKITVCCLTSMLIAFMPPAQALSWEISTVTHITASATEDTGVLNSKLPEVYDASTVQDANKMTFDRKAQTRVSKSHISNAFQTPVIPEPQTYAMILTGLGLLFVTLRRRKGHYD